MQVRLSMDECIGFSYAKGLCATDCSYTRAAYRQGFQTVGLLDTWTLMLPIYNTWLTLAYTGQRRPKQHGPLTSGFSSPSYSSVLAVGLEQRSG